MYIDSSIVTYLFLIMTHQQKEWLQQSSLCQNHCFYDNTYIIVNCFLLLLLEKLFEISFTFTEKRKRQRIEESAMRRRDFQGKLGGYRPDTGN